jgi:hypothetical protein
MTSKDVLRYLNGRKAGPVTLFWHRKHDALKGFWEFAIRRGYTDRSPVPVRRAKEPVRFVPYTPGSTGSITADSGHPWKRKGIPPSSLKPLRVSG